MLWDVWTKIAADPIAFESPSAGFALDWRALKGVARAGRCFRDPLARGRFVVDRRRRPRPAAPLRTNSIAFRRRARRRSRPRSRGQAASSRLGRASSGRSSLPPTPTGLCVRERAGQADVSLVGSLLHVVDAILTGVHQPGESHYELLRAFADDKVLERVRAAVEERDYRAHEFGDSLLIERQAAEADVM